MLKVLEPRNRISVVEMAAVVEILADTESDITGMGETITDGEYVFRPLPGSMAATADGLAAYVMAPNGNWVKVGG